MVCLGVTPTWTWIFWETGVFSPRFLILYSGKWVFAQLMEHLPIHIFRRWVRHYFSKYPTKTSRISINFSAWHSRNWLIAKACAKSNLPALIFAQLYRCRWQSLPPRRRGSNYSSNGSNSIFGSSGSMALPKMQCFAFHNHTDFEPDFFDKTPLDQLLKNSER